MSFDDFDPETQTKKEELKKAKQTEMLEEVDFKKYVFVNGNYKYLTIKLFLFYSTK